jgi:hypothetical protein
MTKKEWGLLALCVGLLAVYVFFFTDWFKKKTIHTRTPCGPSRRRCG